MMFRALLSLCIGAGLSSADVVHRAPKTAKVKIPQGTILGSVNGTVESFNGIPYAEPPTGPLRLKPPQRLNGPLGLFGVFDGRDPAGLCPQFIANPESTNFLESVIGSVANLPFIQDITGQSEDCLTITVTRPANLRPGTKLPVLYWIYGGAFGLGWSSMYDGSSLVNHSMSIGKPFVFVAVNYRVGGFGFLGGKEILDDGAANLGLLDQRMGLEWVADNIASFGGDPDKVTIWGESAGAISVFDQMALFGGDHTYKGKPLFRGAIMSSGSTQPAEPVDGPRAQAVYDDVVEAGGCAVELDTLECLRGLKYVDFLNAVSHASGFLSYAGIALPYLPRPDGRVLPESPEVLAQQGQFAPVPFIIGDQEDEGTLFSLFQSNLTTKADLVDYLHNIMWKSASEDQLSELVDTYGSGSAAVTEGSPFRTGKDNEIFPGFKQRAAVLGDVLFTLTRRVFLESASTAQPEVPSWSYLGTYNYGTAVMGTAHGSDLQQVFFGNPDNFAARTARMYLFNFVYSLDPNANLTGGYPQWPTWAKGRELINFGKDKATLMADDFRDESFQTIKRLGGVFTL